MDISKLSEELHGYINEDYQNRGGNAPKHNKPVDISQWADNELAFSFKNTSEVDGIKAVKRTKEYAALSQKYKINLRSFQDGDYHDDWIVVILSIEV